jgi:hypothetical protein
MHVSPQIAKPPFQFNIISCTADKKKIKKTEELFMNDLKFL